jgi:acyl-CoA reductase-like NAD-dependent aldehyde dehydrogenase
MTDYKLLIDGKLVEGASTLDVINPTTGRILTTAPRADQAQLEQAVAAAKTAFPGWSAKPLGERRRCSSSWPRHSKPSRTTSRTS